jgi:hypothetical protein
MNGFGGDVQRKIMEVTAATTEVLLRLGAKPPITTDRTLFELGCEPNAVLFDINRTFFPQGSGLKENQVTRETDINWLVVEISEKLAAQKLGADT